MSVLNPRFIAAPDVIERRVLFAVELIDPVTQRLVSDGIAVSAAGVSGMPIRSRSGRFVWLVEGSAWPTAITVTATGAPFAAHRQAGPPPPADIASATAAERRVRIVLRPTPAYPFDTGLTLVRGILREQPGSGSSPVAGARVQLAWFDTSSGSWTPPPPQPDDVCPETDANGEFVVFVRLVSQPPADPDIDGGLLKARLQFTRGFFTRATPDDFAFLPDAQDAGRVPEGRELPRGVALVWSELTSI